MWVVIIIGVFLPLSYLADYMGSDAAAIFQMLKIAGLCACAGFIFRLILEAAYLIGGRRFIDRN